VTRLADTCAKVDPRAQRYATDHRPPTIDHRPSTIEDLTMHLPPPMPFPRSGTVPAPVLGTHRVPGRSQVPAAANADASRLRLAQFNAMDAAYRSTQGACDCTEVVLRLLPHCDQPISTLAHWIVDRKVVAFDWRSQTLLPLFQFQLSDMSLRPPVQHVVQELTGVLDDWDLALWFALPNHWLNLARPVDAIDNDAPAVLDAARAQRFALA
jgi:hypothetical protein